MNDLANEHAERNDNSDIKDRTELKKFIAYDHPQQMFIPLEYFNKSQCITYNLESVEIMFHLEPIFNSHFLLVVAKHNDKKYKINILQQKCSSSSVFLETVKEFVLPIKNVVITFVLHGGSTVIILTRRNLEYMLYCLSLSFCENQWCIKIKESLTIPKNYYLCPLSSYVKMSTFEKNCLAFAVEKSQYSGPCIIYVYDCTNLLSHVCCIDLTRYINSVGDVAIQSLCFLKDCQKLAVTTSRFQYIEFDISTCQGETMHSFPRYFVDNIWINKIFLASSQDDIVFIVSSKGLIYNTNKKTTVNIKDRLKDGDIQKINIWNSKVCPYNKYIYLYDGHVSTSHMLYVYDPIHEVMIYKQCIGEMYYTNTFTINWFGNQMYRAGVSYRKEICIRNINNRSRCFSLKYWAKFALLQMYSEKNIREMKLGWRFNNYIFNYVDQ